MNFTKRMFFPNRLYFLFGFLFLLESIALRAQRDLETTRTIRADTSFQQRSASFQRLWGKNRRKEWAAPIQVPVFLLDTAFGGLKPFGVGGGNETKTLRLHTANGKEFVLRSVRKSRKDVVPAGFEGTFVEDLIKDGVSSSHPYAAIGLTTLQAAAGIYHTTPVLVFLPRQPLLDTFNQKFGDDLYLLEQRPEGDWSESANLGNFQSFESTAHVIDALLQSNRNHTDQFEFIKARLFDMLIADWDRHEDNWRWGVRIQDNDTLFIPIPKDRDQAFYTHDGFLIDRLLPAMGLAFMQNFGSVVKNINALNIEERNMDRLLANAMAMEDWLNAARFLQHVLTDSVIEQSIRQLPLSNFEISGRELIDKLKARRAQLPSFAATYYRFIAAEVQVPGSKQREYFEAKPSDTGVILSTYRIDSTGRASATPYYTRRFNQQETSEIRIYGIGSDDIYNINNTSPIKIRVIGSKGRDAVIQHGTPISIYDDENHSFEVTAARYHLSDKKANVAFNYESFDYDSKGISPNPFYNYEDRIYIGLNYGVTKHRWRRKPFASHRTFGLNYSLSQNSLSLTLAALYPQLIRKWNVFVDLKYDPVRWTNFYGPGNASVAASNKVRYYRMISHEWMAEGGLRRVVGKNEIEFAAFYRGSKITYDTTRFVGKVYTTAVPGLFKTNHYGGLRITYTYLSINDSVVPTRGISLFANASFENNFTEQEFFQQYSMKLQGYLPLGKKFSLAIRAGAATIVGDTSLLGSVQVHEHAVIGGAETIRGFRRERFWGRSSFYNNNELRFITNFRSHLLNARVGLFAFFDDGRVWMPEETSNILHTSYGGGLLFAPFHQICFTITYGISDEAKLFQFRINSLF